MEVGSVIVQIMGSTPRFLFAPFSAFCFRVFSRDQCILWINAHHVVSIEDFDAVFFLEHKTISSPVAEMLGWLVLDSVLGAVAAQRRGRLKVHQSGNAAQTLECVLYSTQSHVK